MSRKRTLRSGDPTSLNSGHGHHGGTHQKSIPESAIVKLHNTGLSPRRIAKKLGTNLADVERVLGQA